MRKTAPNSSALVLTVQERTALSIALKTTLKLWVDSEDKAQERVRGKLQSVLTKLNALAHSEMTSIGVAASHQPRATRHCFAMGGSAAFPDRP
jgi:hypothetical protein